MTRTQRYIAAAAVIGTAFISSYVYAQTSTSARATSLPAGAMPRPAAAAQSSATTDPAGSQGAAAACACCGSAPAGPATTAEATVADGVQRIRVDTSSGRWDPSEIVLAAGIPAEITFAEGQGCLAQVVFPDLGISADLTRGGATVRVPALKAGEYPFSCGMQMVFGKLTVR